MVYIVLDHVNIRVSLIYRDGLYVLMCRYEIAHSAPPIWPQ